jgi:hypothetical protein
MKKLFILSVLMCFGLSVLHAQEERNGNAYLQHKGKLIFVNAIPANPYTIVGKAAFSNSKKDIAAVGSDPTGIKKVVMALEDAIKKETKGKQVPFDAIVVHSPAKIDLIKFSNGPVEANTACAVGSKDYSKKCGSMEIFFMSRPSAAYEEVKVIEVKNFTNLGQMKMGKNDIDNFLNKLYERSCKEANDGVVFDAVLMVDDNLLVNGFIETKTLILIKYKE